MADHPELIVVGGGLAGCEAAWQAAERGVNVYLYEMRPEKNTPAHKTSNLAELICSNSLRSNDPENPHGLLKEELRILSSLILKCADLNSLPAGKALAVNRDHFSVSVTEKILSHKNIKVIHKEITELPNQTAIIATGPLTSQALTEKLEEITGSKNLYFYDAISPVVSGESINHNKAFFASRYHPEENDYLNCPFTEEEYSNFYKELQAGEKLPFKDFESPVYFEGCMPVEAIAERGFESLLYGPMRPVGLTNPATGKRPFAVVQLRREDKEGRMYNLVGFQTRLKKSSQEKIVKLIPGLENGEILRYGAMHRNTYVNAPVTIYPTFECKNREGLFLAGQITGVEGYIESVASGFIAGLICASQLRQKKILPPPETTAIGALIKHITSPPLTSNFQPMNINAGLFPPLGFKMKKKEKMKKISERALSDLKRWMEKMETES